MAGVQLRLLASPSVRKSDVAAVERAARSFRTYGGVEYDVMGADRKSMRTVRYGAFMTDLLSRPDVYLISDLAWERTFDILHRSFFTKDRLGVGITTRRLFTMEGNKKMELMGSGLFASCAFLSTATIDNGLPRRAGLPSREKLIEYVAKHEMGHVLMDRSGHCEEDSCVMRANKNGLDSIVEMTVRGLGFCRSCETRISKGVRMIQEGAK